MNMKIKLNNGYEMPVFGMGTFKSGVDDMQIMVDSAIKAGYRAFDTAFFYGNEEILKNAISKNGINRDELVLTSKIWCDDLGYDKSLKAFDKSEKNLGKIDILLIHWPCGDTYKDAWKAFEEIYKDKRVSAIGVSNFLPQHINYLKDNAEILPMLNQIEAHINYHQEDTIELCKSLDIAVQAYSPLKRTNLGKYENDKLAEIGEKYSVSWAQVTLRYLLQIGLMPIPKSVTPERIISNIDVFDFELNQEEMKTISDMNSPNGRTSFDPLEFMGVV